MRQMTVRSCTPLQNRAVEQRPATRARSEDEVTIKARANEHERNLIARIERAQATGKHRRARHLRRMYHRSFAAKVKAVDTANKRRRPEHRLTDQQIIRQAATLNPWKHEDEPVPIDAEPKSDGGWRLITKLKVRRKALAYMAARVLSTTATDDPRIYSSPGRGGCPRAAKNIKAAMKDGYVRAVKIDIRNFFANLDHDGLRRMLRQRLPAAVVDNVILPTTYEWTLEPLTRRGDADIDQITRHTAHKLEEQTGEQYLYDTLSEGEMIVRWVGRGIAQGSPASAIVAQIVIADILGRLRRDVDVRVFAIADDILVMTRTMADARAIGTSLEDALADLRQ